MSDSDLQDAPTDHGRAQAVRNTMRRVLREHWLTSVECNAETETDTAHCYCTVWSGRPQPSVGKAVEEWIEHVLSFV